MVAEPHGETVHVVVVVAVQKLEELYVSVVGVAIPVNVHIHVPVRAFLVLFARNGRRVGGRVRVGEGGRVVVDVVRMMVCSPIKSEALRRHG